MPVTDTIQDSSKDYGSQIKTRLTLGIAFVLAAILALATITACSTSKTGITGTWYASNGEGNYAYLTFNSDGTGSKGVTNANKGIPFTWKQEGSTISMTEGGSPRTAQLSSDGSKITYQDALAKSINRNYSDIYCKNKADADIARNG